MKYFWILFTSLVVSQAQAQITPIVEKVTDDRAASFNLLVDGKKPLHVITAAIVDVVEEEGIGLGVVFEFNHGRKNTTIYLPYNPSAVVSSDQDLQMWLLDSALHEVKPIINLQVAKGVKKPGCDISPESDTPGGNVVNCRVDRKSDFYFFALWAIEQISPNPHATLEQLTKEGYVEIPKL